jgi:hypothetical protein
MSDEKVNRGILSHKIHQLQKIVSRFLKFGKVEENSERVKEEKEF